MEKKSENDLIQQAVNEGYEESVNRWRKHVEYKISLHRKKLNELKRKRKQERQNRRKGRR